jgi:arylsulfatase A-like enzyme
MSPAVLYLSAIMSILAPRIPHLLWLPLLFLAACSENPDAGHYASATPAKPNIVFILADDLGYGDLGSYGQQLIATPELNRLATEGIRFTHHYAGSPVCAPSRSVLMTGRHTGHTYIRGNGLQEEGITDSVVTIAEVLKDAGYATALIGKWGLGTEGGPGEPSSQGFDHYFGYLHQVYAHNYFPEFLIRNGERVYLDNTVEYVDSSHWSGGLGSTSSGQRTYSHNLLTAEALEWMEAKADTAFFLYLPYTIPHDNGEQPIADRYEVPDEGRYADRDWSKPERGYAAMISRLDRDVGRIRRHLDFLGIADNTLIVFTSDNGPMKGEHIARFNSNGNLRGGKRDLYEGGIRVPTIAYWPGNTPAGAVTDHVSGFQDWLVTLAGMADIPTDELPSHDGISLLPTLTGRGTQPAHDHLYWEFYEQGGKQAVREGDWKAVRLGVREDRDAPLELYNLTKDPGESNNVASAHPEVVQRMTEIMDRAHSPSELFTFSN